MNKNLNKTTSRAQKRAILKHLEEGKTITAAQAMRLFRCERLAARIRELRQDGYNIITETLTTRSGKRIGEYSLI